MDLVQSTEGRVGAKGTLICGASNWKERVVSVAATGMGDDLCCQFWGRRGRGIVCVLKNSYWGDRCE